MSKRRRHRKPMGLRIRISEQFIPHPVTMLRSAVFRSLRLTDLRILHRLEIEHASHGAKQNGNLTCTYADLVKYGVRRASISASIRRLVRGGFLEVTEQGRQSYADLRTPSRYRITYLPTFVDARFVVPTHEWRLLEKQKAGRANAPGAGPACGPGVSDFPDAKTKLHRQKPDAESRLLSRSRGGGVGVCGTEHLSSAARQYQSPLPAREEVAVPPPTFPSDLAAGSSSVSLQGGRCYDRARARRERRRAIQERCGRASPRCGEPIRERP